MRYSSQRKGIPFCPGAFSGGIQVHTGKSEAHYQRLWGDDPGHLGGTAVSLLVTTMLAYVIARKDFKVGRVFAFMIFFSMLFNGGLVPTYIMLTKYYHLKDTIWALIFPYIIMPWHVFLMKGFLADIPTSLIEAAK